MALNTAWECANLPTWAAAECCGGCHVATNDVRPTRVHWPAGYPVGASTLLLAAGSHLVLCCRAQLHAGVAMGGVAAAVADTLDLVAAPVVEATA